MIANIFSIKNLKIALLKLIRLFNSKSSDKLLQSLHWCQVASSQKMVGCRMKLRDPDSYTLVKRCWFSRFLKPKKLKNRFLFIFTFMRRNPSVDEWLLILQTLALTKTSKLTAEGHCEVYLVDTIYSRSYPLDRRWCGLESVQRTPSNDSSTSLPVVLLSFDLFLYSSIGRPDISRWNFPFSLIFFHFHNFVRTLNRATCLRNEISIGRSPIKHTRIKYSNVQIFLRFLFKISILRVLSASLRRILSTRKFLAFEFSQIWILDVRKSRRSWKVLPNQVRTKSRESASRRVFKKCVQEVRLATSQKRLSQSLQFIKQLQVNQFHRTSRTKPVVLRSQ